MGSSSDVHKLLEDLRDVPVDTEHISAVVLQKVYQYLMEVPSGSDNVLHWFCPRATPDTVEAASFLIRMFAYDRVDEWRKRFYSCMSGCSECVKGLQRAKVTSKKT